MTSLAYHATWPRIASQAPADPDLERRVRAILDQMTLEEKVGQMIQPELAQVTPDEVRDFKIGSALNGAGVWPGGKRHATVADWVGLIESYWTAADDAYRERPFRIPFVWATDAVHGNNNVYGATIFPHNIGLGAAGDPDLLRRIGAATAREISAVGMDWTFAPTVTTPRDRRWGRYYEGYSEDPELVATYAREMVLGLQGEGQSFGESGRVLATLKHWVADGGTVFGADRGTAVCTETNLRNVHAPGFFAGIEAGAQAVMVSFSSWDNPANYDHSPDVGPPYNDKIHGSRYLVTDVLKDAIGFDGIVISDWDAHREIAGCAPGNANYAVNAGIDVLMVAERQYWREVRDNLIRGVHEGDVPLARIDDAVARMLRVKLRHGLWERPRPRARLAAGAAAELGSPGHRALSREAVRKSLVLLKNARGVLPLSRTARILVTGSGADDIQKQTGGWTLTWQGDDVELGDLPGAQTVAMAVKEVIGVERCTVDPRLSSADITGHDVALMVIGEDSYAEMRGTIKPWRTLEYAGLKSSYADDVRILRSLRRRGINVVTILFTGRPLYVTEEINLSDAFVVAWLPGPEGGGITDVLFVPGPSSPVQDFQGRLVNTWPRRRDSMAVNRIPPHIPDYVVPAEELAPDGPHTPLFPYGYGLSLGDAGDIGMLPIDESRDTTHPPPAGPPIRLLGDGADDGYRFYLCGHNTWAGVEVSPHGVTSTQIARTAPLVGPGGGGGLTLRFLGEAAFLYAKAIDGRPRDLRGYHIAGGRLSLELRVVGQPDEPIYLACHDDFPAQAGLDLRPRLAHCDPETWQVLDIPLAELIDIGMDLRNVDVPFMLYTEGRTELDLATVRWLT